MLDILRVCSGWAAILLGTDVIKGLDWHLDQATYTHRLQSTPIIIEAVLRFYRES